MTEIVDWLNSHGSSVAIVSDFSPPRGSDPTLLDGFDELDVDFLSIAYNPGKSSRVNSAMLAHWVETRSDMKSIFTIATRDMNKLATESLLIGADLLGLDNVVVVRGDEFTTRELERVSSVSDFTPTDLIAAIKSLNEGIDFKGLKLRTPTSLCVGATIDLGRGIEREVELTRRKVLAGAEFFLSQPTFDVSVSLEFLDAYKSAFNETLRQPVFHGVQVLAKDGVIFNSVPIELTEALDSGRSGEDIALDHLHRYVEAGLTTIYLIPPIMRGGRRDYSSAQSVIQRFRSKL